MSAMVVIRCPETDQEVPIGIKMDLHSLALLPLTAMQLNCPACGGRHLWSKKDAYLSLMRTDKQSANR
jgi:hypothetical protein